MAKVIKSKLPIEARYKLIYNPNAGKKRSVLFGSKTAITLEDIKQLFEQYQIPVDYFPTSGPGDATVLAHNSIKEKYNFVIAAGGDGTVSEVAAGLVGSDMVMGILPLGTFMNTATALAIPLNLETAVMVIKMGRTRKIDVGQIKGIDDNAPQKTYYFLENAGVGLEAELQQEFLEMEKGNFGAISKVVRTLFDYYSFRTRLVLDDQEVSVRAGLVEISNGPVTGANLEMAPSAKLNDHRLTVSVFSMSLSEVMRYFLRMKRKGLTGSKKIKRYKSKVVKIYTKRPRMVHADARVFGTTPVTLSVLPNALSVISGFPKPGESTLVKRTPLDP